MPMDRSRYPANWDEIARKIKDKANWQCQECGRPCRKPGQSWADFVASLDDERWYMQTFDEVYCKETGDWGSIDRPQRFTLTVAHLNHIPEDCRRKNLKALCSGCHCRYDLKAMPLKRRLKAEREGQLTLKGVV